jgi:hypothetical protein
MGAGVAGMIHMITWGMAFSIAGFGAIFFSAAAIAALYGA